MTPLRLQRRRISPAYVTADGRCAEKGEDDRYWLDGMPVVYVGRPTRWGNPFDTAAEYREWLHRITSGYDRRREWVMINAPALAGCHLACWCGPAHECHADVLLELANGGTI